MKIKLLAESLKEFRLQEAQSKECPHCGGKLKTIPKKEWGGGAGRKRCTDCGRSFDPDELKEGVGDKYAEKFGVPNEDTEFEKKFQSAQVKKSSEVVGTVKDKPILKNPKSLVHIPEGARGVIMENGDLYLVADAENVIHEDLLIALSKIGLIPSNKVRGWDDQDTIDNFKFATVQRVWNLPVIAVGESYIIPKPKHEEERKRAFQLFKPYFDAAKKKNPQFKFVYAQPRAAAKQMLSSKDYEVFQSRGS